MSKIRLTHYDDQYESHVRDVKLPGEWRSEFNKFMNGEDVSKEFTDFLDGNTELKKQIENIFRNDGLLKETMAKIEDFH